jgi:hypothetical protein
VASGQGVLVLGLVPPLGPSLVIACWSRYRLKEVPVGTCNLEPSG